MLKELDVPYANLDMCGNILWANDAFTCATDYKLAASRSISSVIPELKRDIFPSANAGGTVRL